jgi:hypothetical protein
MLRLARVAIPALALALAACNPGYRPGGNQSSSDAHTYISTPDAPKTIRVLDWTTNTVLWEMDVPVGKQLTIQFYDDHDPKNAARPALMRWELWPAGTEFGELHNAMPVPDKNHRELRMELTRRPATPTPENVEMPGPAAPGTTPPAGR